MNRCPVIRDLLPIYIEGLASEESVALVEAHLHTCPNCKGEYDTLLSPVRPQRAGENKNIPPFHESGEEKHIKALPRAGEDKIIKALQKAEKKRKRRSILLVILCLAAVLGTFGLYLKHQYNHHAYIKHRTTVLSPEEVPSLCPSLILTEEEMDFLEDPGTVFSLLYKERVIPHEEILPYIQDLLPPQATLMEVDGNLGVLCIDYFLPGERILLSYIDLDGDRAFDHLQKLVSFRPGEDGGPDSPVSFEATYDILTRNVTYEKDEELGPAIKLFPSA